MNYDIGIMDTEIIFSVVGEETSHWVETLPPVELTRVF